MIGELIDAMVMLAARTHGGAATKWSVTFNVKEGKQVVALSDNAGEKATVLTATNVSAEAAIQELMDGMLKKVKDRRDEDDRVIVKAEHAQAMIAAVHAPNNHPVTEKVAGKIAS